MNGYYSVKCKLYNDAAISYMKCWELKERRDLSIGYQLAYCLMMTGKAEECLSVCRAILDINPLFKDIREKIMLPAFKMLH